MSACRSSLWRCIALSITRAIASGDVGDGVDRKAVARVDLHHEATDMAIVKRLPRAQRLVKDHTESIDIDSLIDLRLSGQYLGRPCRPVSR